MARFLLTILGCGLLTLAAGAQPPEAEPVDHGHGVRASQVNLWYQTLRALKRAHKNAGTSLELAQNKSIVENYFPLYLQQKREKEIVPSHLQLARQAFADLPEEDRKNLPLFKFKDEAQFKT